MKYPKLENPFINVWTIIIHIARRYQNAWIKPSLECSVNFLQNMGKWSRARKEGTVIRVLQDIEMHGLNHH